jgi:hypothetical protein
VTAAWPCGGGKGPESADTPKSESTGLPEDGMWGVRGCGREVANDDSRAWPEHLAGEFGAEMARVGWLPSEDSDRPNSQGNCV